VEEQAALRRVATLVASGAPSDEVFATVAEEVARVMHVPMVGVFRYDRDDETVTVTAAWSDRPHVLQPGTRWPLDGPSMIALVVQTGRPARVEDYAGVSGALAAGARASGLVRTAGAPIIVNGSVWGVMGLSSPDAQLPARVEERLADFTELVAAAIANTESRAKLTQLAEEQAALRRVATLVAQGTSPAEVFGAVSAEVARLVAADAATLGRYEGDGTFTALGVWTRTGIDPVGRRFDLEGTVSGLIFATHRPGRITNYAREAGAGAVSARELGWRSSVGAPITVAGRLWGVLALVSTTHEPFPPGTESRLAAFTDIVATAIANAESREKRARLAEEQAALRRVATLVASGVSPAEVLDAVAAEVGHLLGADVAALHRYDSDGAITIVSSYGEIVPGGSVPPDWLDGVIASVKRTGMSARTESHERAPGLVAARAPRLLCLRSAVGAPISVEGQLWGVMIAAWRQHPPLRADDAEDRIAAFTALVATAIANADSRADLEASRTRIVATADATRRRIERELHEGAQQQLLSLALELRAARAAVPTKFRGHRAELSHVAEAMTNVLDELREIALGLHPAILAEGGLGLAVKTLAHRSPLAVELDVEAEGPLPEPVEVAAYYVISEALTNAAKYARASNVRIAVERRGRMLRVAVRDDGAGGADPARGSGLLGLKDRAEAIGGTMCLESPQGAGTSLVVELPLDADRQRLPLP
jgi:signal transduction histidine kinase